MVGAESGAAPSEWRSWFVDGERLLDERVAAGVDDLAEPSLLPGWTRAHVVAHLIGNAGGLGRLVTWAATGQESAMYASAEARAEQIETDAARPADWLRATLRRTSDELQAGYNALTPTQLATRLRTAQGHDRAAAEIAWLRVRESYIHTVDLDIGYTFDNVPPDIVDALLDDAAGSIGGRPDAPPVVLRPEDRRRSWRLGPAADGADPEPEVTGSAAELLAWLIGRSPSVVDRPALPRWL